MKAEEVYNSSTALDFPPPHSVFIFTFSLSIITLGGVYSIFLFFLFFLSIVYLYKYRIQEQSASVYRDFPLINPASPSYAPLFRICNMTFLCPSRWHLTCYPSAAPIMESVCMYVCLCVRIPSHVCVPFPSSFSVYIHPCSSQQTCRFTWP